MLHQLLHARLDASALFVSVHKEIWTHSEEGATRKAPRPTMGAPLYKYILEKCFAPDCLSRGVYRLHSSPS